MADNKINVGGRLHSIATGNILGGANEIFDDDKNKKQSVINVETDAALADRYTKAETYNKTQLDNMITTPEIAYKDYDTYAAMLAETNHPAGAIYRVANYDGTQAVTNKYAEYSWDGTQYKLMAVRDHGIDDEPTSGSDNLVKSGGVAKKTLDIKRAINFGLVRALSFVRVGTLYRSSVDTSNKSCLYNYNYIKVNGGQTLAIEHADDISVRVLEYNAGKVYIKQTDYAKFDAITVGATTAFVRIAANYTERGYSDSIPVSINDYTVGDFEVIVPSTKFFIQDSLQGASPINIDTINKNISSNALILRSVNYIKTSTINVSYSNTVFTASTAWLVFERNSETFSIKTGISDEDIDDTYVIALLKTTYNTSVITDVIYSNYPITFDGKYIYGVKKTELDSVITTSSTNIATNIATTIATNITNNAVEPIANRISKVESVQQTIRIVGDNNTTVENKIYGLKKGHTYRVEMPPTWDITGVTINTGRSIFWLLLNAEDGTTVFSIYDLKKSVSFSKPFFQGYYEFTIAEDVADFAYLSVNLRATKDAEVLFHIVDITNDNVRNLVFDGDPNADVFVAALKGGKTYVLDIFSDTGITYNGPETASLWIEMFYGSSTKVYTLLRTDTFVQHTIKEFTPSDNGYLHIVPLRCGANEHLNIIITEKDSTSFVAAYPQSLTEEQKSIVRENIGVEQSRGSVMSFNESAKNLTIAAKTKFGSYGSVGDNYYLSILQSTDTHSDFDRVDRWFEAGKDSIFDVLIHTGDLVEGPGNLPNYNWAEKVLAMNKPVLYIPGNHEFEYAGGGSYTGLTDEELMNKFYTDALIAHNGETHPVINGVRKAYYHRDITKNGNTIRFIGLYQYEWNSPTDSEGHPIYGDGQGKDVVLYTQEQIDWLISLLESTPSECGVILLSHSPVTRIKYADTPFNLESVIGTWCPPAYSNGRLHYAALWNGLLKAYVDGNSYTENVSQETPDGVSHDLVINANFTRPGLFIANICGHAHTGGIGTLYDNGCRAVFGACGCARDTQNDGFWGRQLTGKLQDCLTNYVYDFGTDKLKIIRYGADTTNECKEVRSFMF